MEDCVREVVEEDVVDCASRLSVRFSSVHFPVESSSSFDSLCELNSDSLLSFSTARSGCEVCVYSGVVCAGVPSSL